MSVGDVKLVTQTAPPSPSKVGTKTTATLRRLSPLVQKPGGERATAELREEVSASFNGVAQQPFFAGVLIVDVLLTSGKGNQLEHGLGRAPLGYVVAGADDYANVCENRAARSATVLELNVSKTATFTLWVF